ncbi:MAG: hypothetical protein EAZ97_05720 [Bacteroidetes bacterium]|nr:MAG: hypothetical protein EAZ97_05720 [Bacteroidota bacterium]
MKTIKKVFSPIILALFLVVNSAFAFDGTPKKGESKVTVSEKFAYSLYTLKNSFKIRFAFDNESGEEVKVKIFDEQGHRLHADWSKSTMARRSYDLEQVGKGIYKIEVKVGEFETTQTVAFGINLDAAPFQANFSDLNDSHVNVRYENGSKGVYIRLVDEKENVVYSEKTEDEANYSRKFNLSRLAKGKYTMQVVYEDKTVEKVYEIK